ncbi:MAG: pyruvate formate lyase-activating protein [Lachnospiraceae bacterium]|nr:pyruvate formate lyase-activating protein [Lachnospiraceae bacterium]
MEEIVNNTQEQIFGNVHSIETFGSVDGPGVRFVIFLQGCHMRCKYCHNPDTWNMEGAYKVEQKEWVRPKKKTAGELLNQALRYKTYWGRDGGITVSGGEALLQIDFVLELFTKAKEMGISTCLDTSANPFTREEPFYSKWQALMKVTDLVMLDLKHIDDEQHRVLTGQSNRNILEAARDISDRGVSMWIRHVLVPGITTEEASLRKLREFIDTLKTVERVEVLPYHTLGTFKWKELGIAYQLEGVRVPTGEEVELAKKILGAG